MAKIIKNGIEYNHSTTNFEIGETPPLDPSVELWFDTSEEMPMADYIVERGTTDGWTWEKWESGKAVMYYSHQITSSFSQTGNLWYGQIHAIPLPFTIVNFLFHEASCLDEFVEAKIAGGNTNEIRYRLVAPNNVTARNFSSRLMVAAIF